MCRNHLTSWKCQFIVEIELTDSNVQTFLMLFRNMETFYGCYRPQRNCGKVMFLHLSVILFTEGEWQTPLGADPPRSRHPPRSACWEIRATSGRYASYWNAYLLSICMLMFIWEKTIDANIPACCFSFLTLRPFQNVISFTTWERQKYGLVHITEIQVSGFFLSFFFFFHFLLFFWLFQTISNHFRFLPRTQVASTFCAINDISSCIKEHPPSVYVTND